MARMQPIYFRVPAELMAEATKRAEAAGVSVGEWTRKLIERETGIVIEIGKGLGNADPADVKRVQASGVRASKKRARERKKETKKRPDAK